MTANHEHTPIGVHQEVLQAYIAQGGTIERFYEWFDATQARAERRGRSEERENMAAAEQRGAVRHLREVASELNMHHLTEDLSDSALKLGVRFVNLIQDRADQMEGDE